MAKRRVRGPNCFRLELIRIGMHGKNKDDRIASPERVAIQLKPIALRKAKIVYNFGLYECNKVKTCFGNSGELR